jgi:polyisoprenoid-binding protein YceI
MKNRIFYSLMASAVLLSSTLFANGGCELAQVGAMNVEWTAYKTAKKVGVSGTFESVTYKPVAKSGENFRSILVGSSVSIDTKSVNTKHESRDATLSKFFFEMMSQKNIEAKIVDIKADKSEKGAPRRGVLSVEIEMNGIKKTVPMKYSFSDGLFAAEGVIDILDFKADKALASIAKECFDLHEGKTWSEVSIGFKTKIEAILCSAKPLEAK